MTRAMASGATALAMRSAEMAADSRSVDEGKGAPRSPAPGLLQLSGEDLGGLTTAALVTA